MKIILKSQQQAVYNMKGNGSTQMAYVLKPVRYSTIDKETLINYCSMNSNIPHAYVAATVDAIVRSVENFLLNGHNINFCGLGTLSLTIDADAQTDINQAGLSQLKGIHIRFNPSQRLKNLLEDVTFELDGIYDIAGTNDNGSKYYKRVSPDDTTTTSGASSNANATQTTSSYTITAVANNAAYGTVTGGGTYVAGAVVTLTATAASGYNFSQWQDGSTQAVRQITVSGNATYTATFTASSSGMDD